MFYVNSNIIDNVNIFSELKVEEALKLSDK